MHKKKGRPSVAAGTAAIIQPTNNASGISGKIRLTDVPAIPPMANKGMISPPKKPADNAPAVASILANRTSTTSPTPIVRPASLIVAS